MALESTTYIDGLVSTNPTGAHARSQGDDHIRLVKSSVKATFPSLTGAVTSTQAELNILDGVTSTTAELNYLDIPTLGTVESSKAITADAVGTTKKLKTQEQTSVVNAIGIVSTSTPINFTAGNVVTAVLTSGGSFTITNAPSSGTYGILKIILTNAGTSSSIFPTSVKWAGGIAPTFTTSGVDMITLETIDAGANWYGHEVGINFS